MSMSQSYYTKDETTTFKPMKRTLAALLYHHQVLSSNPQEVFPAAT
jgi:hypothetical protein